MAPQTSSNGSGDAPFLNLPHGMTLRVDTATYAWLEEQSGAGSRALRADIDARVRAGQSIRHARTSVSKSEIIRDALAFYKLAHPSAPSIPQENTPETPIAEEEGAGASTEFPPPIPEQAGTDIPIEHSNEEDSFIPEIEGTEGA